MKNTKTIIITRAKTDNEQFVKYLDQTFEVLKTSKVFDTLKILSFPTIEISYQNTNFNPTSITDYTHLIFTSQNGVIGFFKSIDNFPIPSDIQIVTIGKKTAKMLEQFGYKSQIISKGNTAEDLAKELQNEHLKTTDSVLLAIGKKAGTVIEQTLQDFCSVKRIEVYDTHQPQSFPQNTLDAINSECFDLVAFTSPSTFENFISTTNISPEKLNGKIACIGTTTASKVTELGYEPNLISSSANLDVFANEIIGFLQ